MSGSEIEQIRQKIAAEYEALRLAMYGYAEGTARHTFINARMRHVDAFRVRLSQLIGQKEATIIIGQEYADAMEHVDEHVPRV